MKHVRILHASDIHIEDCNPQSRPQQALDLLVRLARQNKSDLIIIAGDLFDNNRLDAETVNFSLRKLSSASLPLLILPGNHDCLVPESVYLRNDLSSFSGLSVFTKPQGEKFEFPELDLVVWGKPVMGYSEVSHSLLDLPQRSGLSWHIAVAHGHYVKNNPKDFHILKISEDEIKHSGFDYIALGHDSLFRSVCEDTVKACYCGSASTPGTVAIVVIEDSGVAVNCCRLFQ